MNYLDKTAFLFASVFITPSFGPKYARFKQGLQHIVYQFVVLSRAYFPIT